MAGQKATTDNQVTQTDSEHTHEDVVRESQAEQKQTHATDPGRQHQSNDPNEPAQTIKAPVDNNAHVSQFKTEQRERIDAIRVQLDELTQHLDRLI